MPVVAYEPNLDDIPEGGSAGSSDYVPPSYKSADWAKIADLVAGRTEYRSINFAAQNSRALNLNGTYAVSNVTADTITLANPAGTNPAWTNIAVATEYVSPSLSTQGEGWVGPFVIDQPNLSRVVANFTAPQGMYRVTKKGKDRPYSVSVQLEIRLVDSNNQPVGPVELFTTTVHGDGKDKTPRGVTLTATPSISGRCQVRARRLSAKDYDTEDTIMDEVRWRDGFGTAPVLVPHFGDVTTVHSRTYATSGATAVKERKLNCRATRRVLVRNPDNTFGPALAASRNAADIICHMALDPYLGGRTLAELDVPQLYDTVDEVQQYFGVSDVGHFGYTFDQEDVSFEEMVQTVAQCVFCNAYRQGSKLRLFFERARDDSTLLFNHRNKVPKSERRTVRFGYLNDFDGVELDYSSDKDGAKLTVYVPEDRTAVKAKKLEIVGVQSEAHAKFHADRTWAKIRFQHTSTSFTALSEATQLVRSERVEVADNTRADVADGFIVSQDGLVFELSQPFEPAPGVSYTMFVQLQSGEVETIPVVNVLDPHKVMLEQPPSVALNLDPELSADVPYQIVGDDNARPSAFIVTEKGAYSKGTLTIDAINYDPRYYEGDHVLSKRIVDERGNGILTENGQFVIME